LVAVFLALGLLGAVPRAGRAAEQMPYEDTWKLTVQELAPRVGGLEVSFCLVKLTRDGRFAAEVIDALPAPLFRGLKAGAVTANAKSLAFQLKSAAAALDVKVYPPAGEKKPKVLRGTVRVGGRMLPLEMERTESDTLDRMTAQKVMEGRDEWLKALRENDLEERAKLLAALAKDSANKPIELLVCQTRVETLLHKPAPDAKAVQPISDRLLRLAAHFGPDLELEYAFILARMMGGKETLAAPRLTYARQAAKLLTDEHKTAVRAIVLRQLSSALRGAGKPEEADKLAPKLAKLDKELDAEFAKHAVPFKPEKFAGRTSRSDRVAVVELFTGAHCGPCVPADIAFDAMLQAYPARDVALLQYHLHVPAPDPLTSADGFARARYYGDAILGTGPPRFFLNGKLTPLQGGLRVHGKVRYDALRKLVDDSLEKDADAKVKLNVGRKGDEVSISGRVDGLEKPGEDLRLRLALIEDVVAFAGSNGQRLHHHVVRALPGGPKGFKLEKKDGNTFAASVKLGELRKKLEDYLAEYAKSDDAKVRGGLPKEKYPMELKKLKVVALVQNDEDRTILQAAQVDVPDEK
jgi:hypothetical protein